MTNLRNYFIYDDFGEILQISETLDIQTELKNSKGIGFVEVPTNFQNLNISAVKKLYVDLSDKSIKNKENIDLNISDDGKGYFEIGDSISFNVPSNCYVDVNGEIYKSGSVSLDTSKKTPYYIKVCGKKYNETTLFINDYVSNREREYPELVDQLDDIYHNGIDGWKAKIKAVKDKYPKS